MNYKIVFNYLLVGGFVSVLDWILFYILNTIFSMYYIFAAILSFIICTILHLVITRKLVFNVNNNISVNELYSIVVVNIVGLCLSTLFMYILGEYSSLSKFVAKIFVTAIILFYNFAVRYFIIYKK